jgi:putative hydrolase of the HAD superfamily
VTAARSLGWQAIHCEAPSALPAQLAPYLPVRSTLSTSKPSERA